MPEKPDEQAVCARCGAAIDPRDHFIVADEDSDSSAAICRAEHLAAWVMRGAAWQFDRPWEVDAALRSAAGPVQLERHRDGEIVRRRFADPEDLRKWSLAGGFWSEK
jgi:hypothetical protein